LRLCIRGKPGCHVRILPCGQQVSHDQPANAKSFAKKSVTRSGKNGERNNSQDQPIDVCHCWSPGRLLHPQFATCKLRVSLKILFAGLACHFSRQCRSRWLLVPADFLEVIPNVLLVKRFLRLSRLVFVRWPEAGGIWCKHFVGQSDAGRGLAELKLGVGDDYSLRASVVCGGGIKL